MRKTVLVLSTVIGVTAALGAVLFYFLGAGYYGSPFSGDTYFNITLLLVLAFGPLALLPCVILDWWKPGVGGVVLCGFALAEIVALILNNIRDWGFARYDAALGSLCLAVPMLLLGTLLFKTGNNKAESLRQVWRFEILIAAIAAVGLGWLVASDFF